MYEIKKHTRIIGGHGVPTYTRDIIDCNILEAEAGTNGYKGGDTGHGSRTYIRIEDITCTDIRICPIGKDGQAGVEIYLGGDSELHTMIQALEFILQALKDGEKEEIFD